MSENVQPSSSSPTQEEMTMMMARSSSSDYIIEEMVESNEEMIKLEPEEVPSIESPSFDTALTTSTITNIPNIPPRFMTPQQRQQHRRDQSKKSSRRFEEKNKSNPDYVKKRQEQEWNRLQRSRNRSRKRLSIELLPLTTHFNNLSGAEKVALAEKVLTRLSNGQDKIVDLSKEMNVTYDLAVNPRSSSSPVVAVAAPATAADYKDDDDDEIEVVEVKKPTHKRPTKRLKMMTTSVKSSQDDLVAMKYLVDTLTKLDNLQENHNGLQVQYNQLQDKYIKHQKMNEKLGKANEELVKKNKKLGEERDILCQNYNELRAMYDPTPLSQFKDVFDPEEFADDIMELFG